MQHHIVVHRQSPPNGTPSPRGYDYVTRPNVATSAIASHDATRDIFNPLGSQNETTEAGKHSTAIGTFGFDRHDGKVSGGDGPSLARRDTTGGEKRNQYPSQGTSVEDVNSRQKTPIGRRYVLSNEEHRENQLAELIEQQKCARAYWNKSLISLLAAFRSLYPPLPGLIPEWTDEDLIEALETMSASQTDAQIEEAAEAWLEDYQP